MRGGTLIFVCSYGCVVGPAGGPMRKLAGVGPARRGVGLHSAYINWFLTGILHIRKNTQKSKFLLSQAFKWGKNYVFRNPRDAI